MSVKVEEVSERFGPPVAVSVDRACIEAELRQQWNERANVHERMYALPRVHLRYDGNLVVSTFRDGGPTADFDVSWRFALPLLDLYHRGGTEDHEPSSLSIDGIRYPATRYTATNDFGLRLDGCAAHIADLGSTAVVIGPPEQLSTLQLGWVRGPRT